MTSLKSSLSRSLLSVMAVGTLHVSAAFADISFVSGTNGVTLHETIVDGDNQVFVLKGLSNGDSSDLSFSTTEGCSLIGMVGGAKFDSGLSCDGGVINTSVVYKGGLSFGPGTEDNKDSFYVTFSAPPAAPGSETPAEAFNGIQIAVYGDISSWDMTGNMSESGASFGVELSGPQGGSANFNLDLPKDAVDFLGGVLGVSVGGKPDPFATVATKEDGSVSLKVAIASLQTTATRSSRVELKARTVKKKIVATKRKLSIASKSASVKSGGTLNLALCSGTSFKKGDNVPVSFTVGGKSNKSLKSTTMELDAKGCSKKSISLSKKISGTITAKAVYRGKNATAVIKVVK